MNKEIITKLQNRKRVSDKLGNELDKFVEKLQNLEGIETVKLLQVRAQDYKGQPVWFGILQGDVGFFRRDDTVLFRGDCVFELDDYLELEGVCETLELLRKFFKKIDELEDFSRFDKPLKDLLFGEKKE